METNQLVDRDTTLLPLSNMAHAVIDSKYNAGQMVLPVQIVPGLQSQAFAGRLGGNQQFAVSSSDPDYERLVAKEPDAGRESSWKALLNLRGFYDQDLYRLGAIECMGKSVSFNQQ